MSAACYLDRVALYTGVSAGSHTSGERTVASSVATETCEYCASPQLTWRKCKQVCLNCGHINRSCADL